MQFRKGFINVNIDRINYFTWNNNICLYAVHVNSNAHTTQVRIYGEPYAPSWYFLEYHPSSNKITRCQFRSRVWAWFYDAEGDIDPMSLSQRESTILHESIIYSIIIWVVPISMGPYVEKFQNWLFNWKW